MGVDISIVICTHNRYDILVDAIASIEAQSLPKDSYELVLVDNSTDLAAGKAFHHELRIDCRHKIVVEATPGLSRARNAGVRAAEGRIVAFLDDDARAEPHWAEELVGAFSRNPSAGVVGGPVRPIWSAPRPPWLHRWLEGFLTIVDRGSEERPLTGNEWLAGTNIAFLRGPLIEAGLFEERLGRMGKLLLSNEELATTQNLKRAGYSVVYNPRAAVRHIVHAERLNPAWMRQRVFWQTVSDLMSAEPSDPGLNARIERIVDFQGRLPPKDRGLTGLFKDTDDPELFHRQLEALSTLLTLVATDARDWRAYLLVEAKS